MTPVIVSLVTATYVVDTSVSYFMVTSTCIGDTILIPIRIAVS